MTALGVAGLPKTLSSRQGREVHARLGRPVGQPSAIFSDARVHPRRRIRNDQNSIDIRAQADLQASRRQMLMITVLAAIGGGAALLDGLPLLCAP